MYTLLYHVLARGMTLNFSPTLSILSLITATLLACQSALTVNGHTLDSSPSHETDEPGEPADPAPQDPQDPDDGLTDFERCFKDILTDNSNPIPDYDQFSPVIGSHCHGTNHQDITGLERVVFLGDSVTVGTPPSTGPEFYRNLLTRRLATEFSLQEPDWLWQGVNVFEGTTIVQDSGDFSSCAEWGARADDLMRDKSQVENCLPEDQRDKSTLVVMTVGGNDLAKLTQGFIDGKTSEELWAQTEEFVALVRDAVTWIKEPGRFPAGVHVVFSNLYEYTDGTGDTGACPTAVLGGFGATVSDPALAQMVVWAMEQYMSVAVQTQSDMLFLLESFCGHGYKRDDPASVCYRGPDTELWFDISCIHPNPTGHAVIADMFMNVVLE